MTVSGAYSKQVRSWGEGAATLLQNQLRQAMENPIKECTLSLAAIV